MNSVSIVSGECIDVISFLYKILSFLGHISSNASDLFFFPVVSSVSRWVKGLSKGGGVNLLSIEKSGVSPCSPEDGQVTSLNVG